MRPSLHAPSKICCRRQHAWLITRGVPDVRAALAIHSAVLILSGPGLRAEAAESNLPLEVVEYRAIREAAADVAHNYDISESRAYSVIGKIVARTARDGIRRPDRK